MPARDPTLEALGRNLRAARADRGLTQESLAHAANLNTSHVARIERGEREPGVHTLLRLRRALEIPIDELFVGLDDLAQE